MPKGFEVDYDKMISAYSDAVDSADAHLHNLGLHQAERPTRKNGEFEDLPEMPSDLSNMSYRELTAMMGKLTAWYGYALGRQADAQCQRNCSEEQCKSAWARLRRMKEGTVTDKDDAVRTDSRYIAINSALTRDESILVKLRVIVESLKRSIESVSRALTVLDSRTNVEGRGATAARKQGQEFVRDAFRTGRRSVTDPFKKKSGS